ncbi:uncharacterized protein KY384_008362 [Bacidia gigantensis]|uniref:uncharacterized protein n=1 Tax=Bacidia gigantensis TaxID=2732470 RepID=UPI001D052F88|nr:uncharacterized protein KY384_008362 [Bacidia gigantensis]KAG8526933.1 hypothetical protein KY384_008362 [Bacidia gigantensis]
MRMPTLPSPIDHIKELNNARPTRPFFFLKPPSSLLSPNVGPVLRPNGTNLHYEVELALVIGRELSNFSAADASSAIDAIEGYALAIDMTARNIQDECKKKGLPWTIAKGFDTFCPISTFIPKERIKDPHDVELFLNINGKVRQRDSSSLMLFRIPRLLSEISGVMKLEKGDLVLTGTPKGVGEVFVGDVISAGVEVDGSEINEGRIEVKVEERSEGYIHGG